jgi:protein transport protein SEC61 subunit gamma-like protein
LCSRPFPIQETNVFIIPTYINFYTIPINNNQKIMGQQEGIQELLIEPLRQFAKDSIHLVKKCTKPDRKEFTAIARATGVGFLIMGFIGFFVKLVHIPINNILVGN